MIYDPISDLYLPIWYALTSGKSTQVYELLFNYICIASKNRLDPAHVVCDFEYAMIKTVKNQFPNSRIVGCLFHFKQALRRKMLKLRISEAEVSVSMREGCIDRLTVIRRCDIAVRGIQDVRRIIKRDCVAQGIVYSKDNWKKFWKYFKRAWIKKVLPEWWNINGLNEDIVNRTNKPLERYNRTLNEAFPVPHPDVIQFISIIERQSRDNVRLIEDISNCRARAPRHAGPQQAPSFESDSDLVGDSNSDDSVSGNDDDSDDDFGMGMSPEY
eukprot:jgi/Phyca11/111322/e_gw1.20.607.1